MVNESEIMIVGSGAIGGIVSWTVSKSTSRLVLKVKDVHQKDVMETRGLEVSLSPKQKEVIRNFQVITSWNELEHPPRWIFITLKIPDLLDEVKSLSTLLSSESRLVFFQNGILEDFLPSNIISMDHGVHRVICWWSSQMIEFGKVNLVRSGESHVGFYGKTSSDHHHEELEQLLNLLNSKFTATREFTDIRGSEMAKTIFNSALNGLTYLTGLSLDKILGTKIGRDAFQGIVTEGILLSDALGLTLPTIKRMSLREFSSLSTGFFSFLKKRIYWGALKHVGKNLISSARVSYLRKRRSELPWLNGFLVRKSKQLGIETPWNETLMGYHDEIEEGRIEPSPALLKGLHQKVSHCSS